MEIPDNAEAGRARKDSHQVLSAKERAVRRRRRFECEFADFNKTVAAIGEELRNGAELMADVGTVRAIVYPSGVKVVYKDGRAHIYGAGAAGRVDGAGHGYAVLDSIGNTIKHKSPLFLER
jgi:hypothetical protein